MMQHLRLRLLGLLLASTAGLLAGCGGKDEDATPHRTKDLPFVRLKLKNMNPPGGHPARATATGTSPSGGQTHKAGPVLPGSEGTSPTAVNPGSANAVTVDVTFDGSTATLRGSGTYGSAAIGTVEVDCNEAHDAVPAGGTVRVIFADARPMQTFSLTP